jgi:hypothetical protein
MKRTALLLLISSLLGVFSCMGKPEVVQTEELPPVEQAPVEPEPVPAEEDFDPATISQEMFEETLKEVQGFVGTLNEIIRAKNYMTWLDCLDDSYLLRIGSPEFLREISEGNYLRSQKIVLKSIEDYFNYVVVPSRTNIRVDDIVFISQSRVRAFALDRKGVRLVLYVLEKIGQSWKIIG